MPPGAGAHLVRPVQGDLHAAPLGLSGCQGVPAPRAPISCQLAGPLSQQGVQAGPRALGPGQGFQGAVLLHRGEGAVGPASWQGAAGGGLAVLGRGPGAQGLDLGAALALRRACNGDLCLELSPNFGKTEPRV